MEFTIQNLKNPDLSGKGVAALSKESQDSLGITKGDYVKTNFGTLGDQILRVATLKSSAESDKDRIIQVGYQTRDLIQTRIGQKISISAVDVEPAEEVTLWIAEDREISGNKDALFKSRLKGRGVFTYHITSVQLDTLDHQPIYRDFYVAETVPYGDIKITEETSVTVEEHENYNEDITEHVDKARIPGASDSFDVDKLTNREASASYEDIGGLNEELERLEETVGLPLRFPEVFNKLGISPPKGILLHGSPGTGKTLLARAVAAESDANFISVSGPEAAGSQPVSTAEKLRTIFEEAEEESPSILFIDEIDAIARKRDRFMQQHTREGVTQLLTLMDGLEDRGDIVVIAATNRPDDLDGALRRGGRFTRELEIGIPNTDERLDILKIHTRGISLANDVDLEKFANATHGYVGADLATLVKEAGMAAVRRVAPLIDFESESIDARVLSQLTVRTDDLKEGLAETSPSGMRDVAIESPDVSWDDVGGQDEAKHELQKAVEWPLEHAEGYEYLDLSPATGVLLHGPPGTGKTLIAKAVASETDANFISLKGSELISKWVGESAQNIGKLFDKARRNAPAVLFIDEIDAVLPERDSLNDAGAGQERTQSISQFLTELDGLESLEEVVVIGTTNRKDAIDPAILRGGRLEEHVRVGPPGPEGRVEILNIHTQNKPVADSVPLEALAKNLNGFTGADIERYCALAAETVLEEVLENHLEDFTTAIKNSKIETRHFQAAYQKLTDEKPSLAA